MYFVEVILPLSLHKTFTYKVSDAEFNYIKPGMRIAVPFGKNKMYSALAIELHQNEPTLYEAKEIHEILDVVPLVNKIQIVHWQWIASYYMCAIGDVYRMALPSAFLLESETIISLKTNVFVDETTLSDEEFLVFEALQHQSSIKVQDVISILNKKKVFPIIYSLLEKNIISLNEEIQQEYKPKLIRYIRLHEDFTSEENLISLLDSLKGAKQKELLMNYFQLQAQEKKPISVKLLTEKANVSASIVKALVEKNIFVAYFIQEDRVNFDKNKKENQLQLSNAQQLAFQEIKNLFATKEVTLLQGVTSSGKTEIYTKLIEEYINIGKQVLYLLPEIALTTQLVSRLTAYFGNQVAVFHSKYSNNERVEVWNQVLNNSEKA